MYNRRRFGGHHHRGNSYAIILAIQLANQIYQMENKPPVTLALLAVNVALHFGRGDIIPLHLVPSLWESCLQPRLILEGGQWKRLVLSGFLHADEHHLFYNMTSLLWKGVQLERRYGCALFAAMVAELLLLSHIATVLLAAGLAAYIPGYRYLYMDSCAVGFSAVLFALKVVLGHDSPGSSNIMGFTLPTKYLCWAELFLASYMTPNASFLGHLGGILAGFLHVRLLEPAIRAALRGGGGDGVRPRGGGVPDWASGGGAARQYFSSSGRLGAGSGDGNDDGSHPAQRNANAGRAAGYSAGAGAGGAGGSGSNRPAGGGTYASAIPPRPAAPVAPGSTPGMQPAAPGGFGPGSSGVAGSRIPTAPSAPPLRLGDDVAPSAPPLEGARGVEGVLGAGEAPARPNLSVEQLRQRRLERFGS